MADFSISTAKGADANTTVVQIHGPMLIANVPTFQQNTRSLDSGRVVLDFSDASYMDSAGLGAVMQLYRQLQPRGQRLSIIGLNQRIAALIKLTRADTILDVQPDLAAAERSRV